MALANHLLASRRPTARGLVSFTISLPDLVFGLIGLLHVDARAWGVAGHRLDAEMAETRLTPRPSMSRSGRDAKNQLDADDVKGDVLLLLRFGTARRTFKFTKSRYRN